MKTSWTCRDCGSWLTRFGCAAGLVSAVAYHRAGPAAFTDAELWVEHGAWSRALDTVRAAGADLHEHALPAGALGAVKVSATIALFELEPDGSRTAPAGEPSPK
jgi:hypothetical protein